MERPSWLTADPAITARTGISVTLGVFETLEHDESAALTANDALSLSGEGTQFSVGSEHPGLIETEGSGGASSMLTPPASAMLESPLRSERTAS